MRKIDVRPSPSSSTAPNSVTVLLFLRLRLSSSESLVRMWYSKLPLKLCVPFMEKSAAEDVTSICGMDSVLLLIRKSFSSLSKRMFSSSDSSMNDDSFLTGSKLTSEPLFIAKRPSAVTAPVFILNAGLAGRSSVTVPVKLPSRFSAVMNFCPKLLNAANVCLMPRLFMSKIPFDVKLPAASCITNPLPDIVPPSVFMPSELNVSSPVR